MSATDENAALLERVRALTELAIELGVARLKVGEIEIQPSPLALRPPPPPRAADAEEPQQGESGRRPLTRSSEKEPQRHPLAYFSSGSSI